MDTTFVPEARRVWERWINETDPGAKLVLHAAYRELAELAVQPANKRTFPATDPTLFGLDNEESK